MGRTSLPVSLLPVPADRFVSYGQNHEDVVLWRALGSLPTGRYVDVGANDPVTDSVTKAFYDRGWTGINIEPGPVEAQRLREVRPRDHTVEAAITSAGSSTITLHLFAGTGLSTLDDSIASQHSGAGLDQQDVEVAALSLDDVLRTHCLPEDAIHFLKIDVEGAEADVLASIDLTHWRPWIMVIEATAPNTTRPTQDEWEPRLLTAGYQFRLFDGVSRFYAAEEHAADLGPALSYPACVLDGYVTATNAHLEQQLAHTEQTVHRCELSLAEAQSDLEHTKIALEGAWAGNAELHAQIGRLEHSLSWRITRPLRAVRGLNRHHREQFDH